MPNEKMQVSRETALSELLKTIRQSTSHEQILKAMRVFDEYESRREKNEAV